MFDTVVVFDHLHHNIKVVTHLHISDVDEKSFMHNDALSKEYARLSAHLEHIVRKLNDEHIPLPRNNVASYNFIRTEESNTGQDGYETFVHTLKRHIIDGDIIQAVPSQRIRRSTTAHPFNVYRQLRSVNPSPYMFYVDIGGDFQIVGASPEMLCKVTDGHVVTHPIAGTRKRGKTAEQDDALAAELLADVKERSEHIMLVDLGRNDVNRVCKPTTVKVDSLMHIERYSHVMHIVSHVSGDLRDDQTPFDAFRSIFPGMQKVVDIGVHHLALPAHPQLEPFQVHRKCVPSSLFLNANVKSVASMPAPSATSPTRETLTRPLPFEPLCFAMATPTCRQVPGLSTTRIPLASMWRRSTNFDQTW